MRKRKTAESGRAGTITITALMTMAALAAEAAENGGLRLPATTAGTKPPVAIVIADADDSFPVSEFADSLLARGVAVFETNDTAPRATFRDRAKNVGAAIDEVRARPEIDARRIGLVGFGEANWVAILADSASADVASFVRVSGLEVPPAAHSLHLQIRGMKAGGFSDSTVSAFGTLHGRLLEFIARRSDPTAIRAAIDSTLATREAKRAHRKGWLRAWIELARARKLAPASELDVPRWLLDFDFDPAPLTCASRTPTLAIFGAADSTLLVNESANRLRDALDFCAGTVGDVWVVEGADHEIRVAKDAKGVGERAPAATYFDRVAAWIQNHPPPASTPPR